MSFIGAKLALFIGADLLTILRDDRPDIPFPGHWDFPGGGREGGESPQSFFPGDQALCPDCLRRRRIASRAAA